MNCISHSLLSSFSRRRLLLALSSHAKDRATLVPVSKVFCYASSVRTERVFFSDTTGQNEEKNETMTNALNSVSVTDETATESIFSVEDEAVSDISDIDGADTSRVEANSADTGINIGDTANSNIATDSLPTSTQSSRSSITYDNALLFLQSMEQFPRNMVASKAKFHLASLRDGAKRQAVHADHVFLAFQILEQATKALQQQPQQGSANFMDNKVNAPDKLKIADMHCVTMSLVLTDYLAKKGPKENTSASQDKIIEQVEKTFLGLLKNYPPGSTRLHANMRMYNNAYRLFNEIMILRFVRSRRYRNKAPGQYVAKMANATRLMGKLWNDPQVALEMDVNALNAVLKQLDIEGKHLAASNLLNQAILSPEFSRPNNMSYLLVVVTCSKKDVELAREWLAKWTQLYLKQPSHSSLGDLFVEAVVSVLNALSFCRAEKRTAGQRAEAVLEWMEKVERHGKREVSLQRGNLGGSVIINIMVRTWIHSGSIDRAEYWLHKGMKNKKLAISTFESLLHAYAEGELDPVSRLERAERLMAMFKEHLGEKVLVLGTASTSKVYTAMIKICLSAKDSEIAHAKALKWLEEMQAFNLDTKHAEAILQNWD